MKAETAKKIGLLAVFAAAVAAFFALDLNRYLTLENLKASRQGFAALFEERPLAVLSGYFAIYVAVTGLSLPGATGLSLAAGALFGFATGSVLVSFASSIGATLACALTRYLARDFARRRFSGILARIDEGLAKDGAFYLFSLRLIPLFPFFAINAAFGLTDMGLARFYLVSQLGMLPATLVFVNAGSELGRLTSLSDVLSPTLLVSLALIGIFPLLAKKGLEYVRSRRAG